MQLRYRGIPYRPHPSSVRYCDSVSSAIALTYRGTSYLVERSAIAQEADLQCTKMFLTYRGMFYCYT